MAGGATRSDGPSANFSQPKLPPVPVSDDAVFLNVEASKGSNASAPMPRTNTVMVKVDAELRRSQEASKKLVEKKAAMVEFPPCDYGDVDVTAEAREGHLLKWGVFFRETLLGMFFPWSVPVARLLYGRLACEMHLWWVSGEEHEGVKAWSRKYKNNIGGFNTRKRVAMEYVSGVPSCIIVIGTVLLATGYVSLDSPVLPDLVLGWLFLFFVNAIRGGIKYGYRSKAAQLRLIDHAARRLEEFSFGWYYLPDEWILFLVRLCMAEAQLPQDSIVLLQRKEDSSTDWPSFEQSDQLVHGVVGNIKADKDGFLRVPVLAIMLELALRLRGKPGDDQRAVPSKAADAGTVSKVQFIMMFANVGTAILPTMARVFILEKEWTWSPFEIAISVAAAMQVFYGANFVCMVINAATLVISRRLRLMSMLGGIVDGKGSILGNWRVASTATQFELWDHMRRAFVIFGRNYEKRSVASLLLIFMFMVALKVFVMYMFVTNAIGDNSWMMKHEPVIPAFLAFFPLVFTPSMCLALLKGAELNETAKLRLQEALLRRERECVVERELHLEAFGVGTAERRLECVQQSLAAVKRSVDIAKPMVLLGDRGQGLFPFSYALVVSFLSQNLVNIALLAQVVSFD